MQFPINLNLVGRPVLVVGGGRIAYRKVQQILAAGGEVTVLAPEILSDFNDLPVQQIARAYTKGDVAAFRLVITATGNIDVDQEIYDECEELGIWVNSADDPQRCSFTLPAAFRRGPVMITVSTGGASPALASFLRSELEQLVGPEFAEVAASLAAERAQFHANGVSTEDVDWKPIIREALQQAAVECPHLMQSLTPVEATA
jgi:precorrin-2 dehydrogenase/sirohydrochlorin ferrochelatase